MTRFMLALAFALTLALGFSAPTPAQGLNCKDFATPAEAQENADTTGDVNNLDGNNDGVACENGVGGDGGGGDSAPAADLEAAPAEDLEAAPAADTSDGGNGRGGGNAGDEVAVANLPATGTGPVGTGNAAMAVLAMIGALGFAALSVRRVA